jgi:DNA repair protein RadC
MSDRPYATTEDRILQLVRDDAGLADRVLRLLVGEPCTDAVVGPDRAVAVVLPHLVGRENEALVVVALDCRRRVVDVTVITVGCDGCTIVDPQQLYRWALTRHRPSASIILAHNHPSGDTTPSAADRRATHKVAAAGRVLGIPLADHVVVTDSGEWASMAELGLLMPS